MSGKHYGRVISSRWDKRRVTKDFPAVTVVNLEEIAMDVQRSDVKPVLCEIPSIFHSFDRADKTNSGN